MESHKIIGNGLLAVGIIIIIVSAASMIMVLTRNARPIQFYSESNTINFSQLMPTYEIPGGDNIKVKMPSSNNSSNSSINDSFNLLIHLILMGFLVNVGSKIAIVGAQMVRPIVVKVHKHEQIISPKSKNGSQPTSKTVV